MTLVIWQPECSEGIIFVRADVGPCAGYRVAKSVISCSVQRPESEYLSRQYAICSVVQQMAICALRFKTCFQ